MIKTFIAGLAGLLLSMPVCAAPKLSSGSVVRVQAGSIEGGWHQGRLHLDAQKCWMVKLDKPTRDQYTMLALIVVNQLEVASNGSWSAVGVGPILQAQPAVCREYAND